MRSFILCLPSIVMLGFVSALLLTIDGCCGPVCQMEQFKAKYGGGQDSFVANMPFAEGYESLCVQGAGGDYSHSYTSTAFDVDFDTPNDEDVPVFAPLGGVAYVHDDLSSGFGNHINIAQDDGTYIIIAHLADIFVDDRSEVTAGQMLGYEGTTGASTGDHVHIGRHDGNAAQDGGYGTSLEGLTFATAEGQFAVTDLTCDLNTGRSYTSLLQTPLWHPNGTLVKTPDAATVYLIEDGASRAFDDEESFLSRGHSFANVALVSREEMACYSVGEDISGEGSPASGSGIFADGMLVSELSSSAVYVMSDGIAMPIETWDAYLLMGFENRTVYELEDGLLASAIDGIGSCSTDVHCVTADDVTSCGWQEEDGGDIVDTGDCGDEEGLKVGWTMPGGVAADSITLSGEYVHADGSSDGWQLLAQVEGVAEFAAGFPDAAPGDNLRFAVEFAQGGVTNRSCLAPLVPGAALGTAAVTYRGKRIDVTAANDPSSGECGLLVTVPN